jgi:hypothetical protein
MNFLEEYAHTLFVLFVLAGTVIIIDIHYIGVSAILIYRHNAASLSERVLAILHVGTIESDCFEVGGIRLIRKAGGPFDSILALTARHLQIGRRLLSYHYQVELDEIDRVDLLAKDRWTLVVHLGRRGKPCELRISIPTWTYAQDRTVESFADRLTTLVHKP